MEKKSSSESLAASAGRAAPEINPTSAKSVTENDVQSYPVARVVSEQPYSVFSYGAKLFIVFMAAGAGLMSALAATLYYPALNVLAVQLDVSSALITVSVTTYMLAQAIAPAFIGGLSDQGGRRLAFLICVAIYTVANIGLALQTNFAALLVLRCLQAAGSSPTIALAVAIVADVSTSAERGKFMGYATGGILVGPAVGPVFGGLLAQYLGWRSIFWALLIFGVSYGLVFAIFVPETSRDVVGNGSIPAKGVNISVLGHLQRRKFASDVEDQPHPVDMGKQKFVWPNPLRTLTILKEKESAILLIYNGLFFNGYMVTSIALPHLLQTYYGYDELKVGLCYLPFGAGSLIAAVAAGRMVDRRFQQYATKTGLVIVKGRQQDLTNFPIERARVDVIAPAHVVGTIAFIVFGWLVHYRVHIAAPLTVGFFIGLGVSASFNSSNTLLIDLHRGKPATATAAVNFVRCLISAGGVAAIVPMIQTMGPGWSFTFWGLLFVSIMPMLWVLVRFGPRWRAEMAETKARKEKEKEIAAAEAAQSDSEEASSDPVRMQAGRDEKEVRLGRSS